MPYSNRRTAFGRRSGTVTVIEEPVRRNAARTAKIAFWVISVVVGILAATVAASFWQPTVALLIGAAIGAATGLVTGAFIVAWPVIRAIWWWATEIAAASGLFLGWIELAHHASLPYRIGTVALAVGVPAAIAPIRRAVVASAWCVITRHRLRTCFNEFIITNRTGSLPLILAARPTQVGERVWIWLRPGLALDDLQGRLDQIAVACWSTSVTAEPASDTNSALIRVDVKRRNALTATLKSPLLGLIVPTPATERETPPIPDALDLSDVAATDVGPARPARKAPKTAAAPPVIKPVPAPAGDNSDDVADWI